MRNKVAILFLSSVFLLSSYSPLNVQDVSIKTVVIDAGHGGKDPGCLGKHIEEADVALGIALKLKQMIKDSMPEIKVVLTRDTDKFIELHNRAKIANTNGADLFISIHCNAATSGAAYGTETYTMGMHKNQANKLVMERENAVIKKEKGYEQNYAGFEHNDEYYVFREIMQGVNVRSSQLLAQKIEFNFEKKVKRHSRGVNQAGFLVLWKTTMPSVLIETGFLTNSKEEAFLKTKDGQNKIASGIFGAIVEYKDAMDRSSE